MSEAKRGEVAIKQPVEILTDDSVIAAMLQKDEEQYGNYEAPETHEEAGRKVLTQSDAPAVDFIHRNYQTLINSINTHYWEELFSFTKLSDELEDDDVVRMINCDKSGFQVSIAPKKVRGKTVHTLIRRIDFNDDVFTEKEFMDEFFEAVKDANRDGEYEHVNKLSTVLRSKLSGAKDFTVHNDKKIRHPPKQRAKGRINSSEIGPAEELLMANKESAKEIKYLKAAMMPEFHLNPESRTEQILKIGKHERLTVAALCKKAFHKFRMKGANLVAIYDNSGQEVRSKASLSTLKTGDLLFFSTKRGQDKLLEDERKQTAVNPAEPKVGDSVTETPETITDPETNNTEAEAEVSEEFEQDEDEEEATV